MHRIVFISDAYLMASFGMDFGFIDAPCIVSQSKIFSRLLTGCRAHVPLLGMFLCFRMAPSYGAIKEQFCMCSVHEDLGRFTRLMYAPTGHRRGGKRRHHYIRARPTTQPHVRQGHRRGGRRCRVWQRAIFFFCAASP